MKESEDWFYKFWVSVCAFFAVLFLAGGGGAPGPGKTAEDLEDKKK